MIRLWTALRCWWDQRQIKVGTLVGTPKGFGRVLLMDRRAGIRYLTVVHGEGVYMHRRSDCWRWFQ